MSTDYDIYCITCEDYANVFNCTWDKKLLPVLEYAKEIAALADALLEVHLEMGGSLDTSFFKNHLGHELVIRSGEGEIITLRDGEIDRVRGIDLEIQSYEQRIQRLRTERWTLFPKTPAMEKYLEVRGRYQAMVPKTNEAIRSEYTAAWNTLTAEEQDQIARILKGNP